MDGEISNLEKKKWDKLRGDAKKTVEILEQQTDLREIYNDALIEARCPEGFMESCKFLLEVLSDDKLEDDPEDKAFLAGVYLDKVFDDERFQTLFKVYSLEEEASQSSDFEQQAQYKELKIQALLYAFAMEKKS